MSSIVPAMPKPALQTITSSRPNRSTAADTNRSMSSTDVTSATIGSASPPAASTSRAAASSISLRRAHIATAAPSRASRTAVARPMPAEAPVMATTRMSPAYTRTARLLAERGRCLYRRSPERLALHGELRADGCKLQRHGSSDPPASRSRRHQLRQSDARPWRARRAAGRRRDCDRDAADRPRRDS